MRGLDREVRSAVAAATRESMGGEGGIWRRCDGDRTTKDLIDTRITTLRRTGRPNRVLVVEIAVMAVVPDPGERYSRVLGYLDSVFS